MKKKLLLENKIINYPITERIDEELYYYHKYNFVSNPKDLRIIVHTSIFYKFIKESQGLLMNNGLTLYKYNRRESIFYRGFEILPYILLDENEIKIKKI